MLAIETIPLGLYIHLPWCIRKCPYCDFNSHLAIETPYEQYVDALLDDLARDVALTYPREVSTIFIGGGTPSLFPAAAIERLLRGVRSTVQLKPDAEVTLEANPGAAETARFAAYLAAGVNRLSIGVQSFSDARLATLGRIHGGQEAVAAVVSARAAGCDRINIDLMHGLPGSADGDSLADLRAAIELEPAHLSWYQLTIEAGTAFARKPPLLPAHDQIVDEFESGVTLLSEAGYERYEISAFAQPNERSRHNLNYWEFGDYLGIGAGAHGKVSAADGVYRSEKRRSPSAYLSKYSSPGDAEFSGPTPGDELIGDFAINAFRLRDGFARSSFAARTGLPLADLDARLNIALDREWIEVSSDTIRPSELGYRFLNDLQLLFISDPHTAR